MPYNPKSLKNLKSFKKGDERTKEAAKKAKKASDEKKKEKKSIQEVAKAVLDHSVSDSAIKQIKEIYPDLDETHLTQRLMLFMQLLDIARKAERDSDKITAINTIFNYAGESPEAALLKQTAELQAIKLEEDPFTKSIKELFKK